MDQRMSVGVIWLYIKALLFMYIISQRMSLFFTLWADVMFISLYSDVTQSVNIPFIRSKSYSIHYWLFWVIWYFPITLHHYLSICKITTVFNFLTKYQKWLLIAFSELSIQGNLIFLIIQHTILYEAIKFIPKLCALLNVRKCV